MSKWKSILQKDDGTCYLCRILHEDWTIYPDVEKHHVFGGNRWRDLSEQFGFYVNLCPAHHRTGPEAVHDSKRSGEMKKLLFLEAEKKFLETHTMDAWMTIMGKNWI